MKILLLGTNGQVGWELQRSLQPLGEVIALGRQQGGLGGDLSRPEYLIATVTWLVFAGLLVTRSAYGWRGRRSARLTLVGFAAALIVLAIYLVRRGLG